MIWKSKKERMEIEQLEHEVEEVKKETAEIKRTKPQIDRLVKDLHEHLRENNFGNRLYLSMIESRR